MTRAANMQALTDDVKRQWPGVVVYGIGDAAHKASASGHNEDDTPGSRPELEDADNRPEHRAIDIMLGPKFTKADADALVARLVADPKARARLYYVIWNGYIWSRSNGWRKTKYTGADQHTGHVHASGWAADDENAGPWPAVAARTSSTSSTEDDMTAKASSIIEAWGVGDPSVEPVKWRIRDEAWQKRTDATLAAVLAAAKGLDTKAILDRIDQVAAVESERDAALVELVRRAGTGELTAEQVVDELAARLVAGDDPAS
ncbi:hypothetical protein [Micromonospora sp. WMMD710]|uniref:hypothetical protein n=1 Tax=Micromonospora sp. WMMD710 TaxID=3016085 RepID=UPI002415E878|nr:hypothetical protein [Micromonospora sp. WMMD710]MDG4762376.1 hypothetical protein [Micromonospora sp. WMMD710]MDG4762380.1 hypothetical protein [Micromonospora sp. WMMD710]MDG4762422.1 hypothetical protein [Micromonospora sp. WMMD710]MDG4762468.1 hypothetical protein [Micromonospora sp. WMMD710]MDG4762503.1 hypothetical protein [Micromonospora sp. WMMD710]